jgi:hypothetical protein
MNRDSHDTDGDGGGLSVDRDRDPYLSVQNTPFSVASVETTGTSHAEVSEAMAVNIYPHQSKSVVLVNHSAKPSESSSVDEYKRSAPNVPLVKTTDANGGVPATPPQQFSVEDVDSPLRNPRAPPKPPAINFIPATPSGLTPTTEKQKQLGNYYEMTAEKPKRSMSLLRRALTRRTADYGPSPSRPAGLLTRTFSLSRNIRRRDDDWPNGHRLKRHSTADDVPADETRLHPFWRPAHMDDEDTGSSSGEEDYDEDDDHNHSEDDGDRTYRYPPIDNRPSPPLLLPPRRTRSLSARIKRTFAILPLRDDEKGDEDFMQQQYPATAHDATDRRTIRRTPSGNLRVMKFRRSMESLTGGRARMGVGEERPGTASAERSGSGNGNGGGRYARLWRSLSLKGRARSRSSVRGGGGGGGGGGGVSYTGKATAPSASAAAARARPAPAPATVTGSGSGSGSGSAGGGFLPSLSDKINIPRRLSERRREKRTQELRGMISGPREVRDGVGDVIRRNSWRGMNQNQNGDADAAYVSEQQAWRRRGGRV